jgi:hypothetical protein
MLRSSLRPINRTLHIPKRSFRLSLFTNEEGEFRRKSSTLIRDKVNVWSKVWANKDIVAITTVMAGVATAANFFVENHRLDIEERKHEAELAKQKLELDRHSTDRKIQVIKSALLTKMEPPKTDIPHCDIPEAEQTITRRMERSPILVVGYQGVGKTTMLNKMIADRRANELPEKNQPAFMLSLRKCIRDRTNEKGVLFKMMLEEIGIGEAVQQSFVVDDMSNGARLLYSALKELRQEGYGPCLFAIDDVQILFQDPASLVSKEAAGWAQWLLEMHQEKLIKLAFISSEGSAYLKMIHISGYEARLERVHFPKMRVSHLTHYLLDTFNPTVVDGENVGFNERNSKLFAKIFTGFTDIQFAMHADSVEEYVEGRMRTGKSKLKKVLQQNRTYGVILSNLPCEMYAFEKALPHLAVAEIETYLDELVSKHIVAAHGNEWHWNRRLLKEAYGSMGMWDRRGGMGFRRVEKAIKWFFWW